MEPGDTIILTYRFNITSLNIVGCGIDLNFNIQNRAIFQIPSSVSLLDTVSTNNVAIVLNGINSRAVDLSISKSVSPVSVSHLDSVTVTYIFQNASGGVLANNVYWSDTLPSHININMATITCTAGGGATCYPVTYDPLTRVLRQDITSIPTGGILTVMYIAEAYNVKSEA